MEASMQHRPQERTFGMVMREVDKDLALFLEMRNRENEKSDLFLNEKVDRVDDLTEIKCEEFLANGVEDESDFNWLLSGRDTPRCVPSDVEKTASLNEKNDNPNSPALTSRSSRTTSSEDSAPLKSKSKQPAKPANIKSSAERNRRPTSSGGRSVPSRPATPTARPSLPVMSKPSRSSTPTSRGTGPSSKTLAPAVRSSTPTRVIARSSTPPTRSSVPSSSKSVSRAATPTRSATSSTLPTTKSKSRSATPTSTARSSAASTTKTSSRSATPTYKSNSTLPASSGQSSKVPKVEPTTLKSSVPSRGTSPTVKSRPSKQSELPSFPRDATVLSTSTTKRPNSASRVRPSASNSCTLMEASSTGNFRQQSSSPSRARSSNMNSRSTGPAMLSKSYNYGSSGDDDVNPVLIGTQMVERVVNMRKLAPPKQAEPLFDVTSSKKSSNSQGNSGFGRSLSKKSLDMAIRHMDLTRSVAGGDIRLSKVNTSASSFNVRNGPALSKTLTVSKSELPTRSNASSEPNLSANTQGLMERPIDKGVAYNDRLSVPPDFQQGQ